MTTANSSLKMDDFGCCARYRECSEAGVCVRGGEADAFSDSCLYKTRMLTRGEILFSKRANAFDASVYGDITAKYEALSGDRKQEYDGYLGHFFKDDYLVDRGVFLRTQNQAVLARAGLLTLRDGRDAAEEIAGVLMFRTELRPLIPDGVIPKPKGYKEVAKALASGELESSIITDKYVIISLDQAIRPYLLELFIDFAPKCEPVFELLKSRRKAAAADE